MFSNSDQEITLDFGNSLSGFRISFIYANVLVSARKRLWDSLSSIAPSDKSWLLIGDFNAILGAHERSGGRLPNSSSCADFANMIAVNSLQYIPVKGAFFTWSRFSARGFIECRLDRALCNSKWLDFWGLTTCHSLP